MNQIYSPIYKKSTFQRNSTPFLKTYFLKEESPINLIEFRRDKLVLNENALKIIRDIKDNIIVVSIFGKERTGKSYLMNLLLNSEDNVKLKGFKVSSQISTSRGLWIWNTPISKSNSKEKIIFLDSEGINSENIYNQQTDSILLALILLISSFFIYNTMGDINSDSLNELELIVHLADSIRINERINKDKLISELCPKFIWSIRDFDLQILSPKNGDKMTEDIYMEKCLKERFDGKNKDELNMIKENLIKYFKQRECVALPRPLEEEKEFIMLKRRKFSDLHDDFKNKFSMLKNKIYKSSHVKMINGKPINGPMIAYLLTKFVKIINRGKIPNISNIFNEMIIYNLEKKYNHAINYFKEKLNKLKSDELDLDIKEIYSIKYEAIKDYMDLLENYPEITTKNIYLKEYELRKEKLENEIEKIINEELNVLISNPIYDDIFNNKENKNKEYKKSEELIEDYLNCLSEYKINSDITILNNKDFDDFLKNDIQKTREIIDFMEKNKEFSSEKKNLNENEKLQREEINKDNNKLGEEIDKEYDKLKNELEQTEKDSFELIGKFAKLLDKRDKYAKNAVRSSFFYPKHSIKSYSNKLVNIYYNEEKLCELSSEEKPTEKCYCNLERFKKCFIY